MTRPGGLTMHDDFRRLERIEKLAFRMDRAFRVPIIGTRIGWDGILGFVPGIGDTLAAAPAAYIILTARRMGVPNSVLLKMIGNSAIDYVIGLVPLVGDLFDIGYKSNMRNVGVLRRHLETRHGAVPGETGARTL